MRGMHDDGRYGVINRRGARHSVACEVRSVGRLVSRGVRGTAVDAGAVHAVTTGPALAGNGGTGGQPFSRSNPVIHVGPC